MGASGAGLGSIMGWGMKNSNNIITTTIIIIIIIIEIILFVGLPVDWILGLNTSNNNSNNSGDDDT